jgi:hypothetical protein
MVPCKRTARPPNMSFQLFAFGSLTARHQGRRINVLSPATRALELYRPKLRLRLFLRRRRFRERDGLSTFGAIDGEVPFVWFNLVCHDEFPYGALRRFPSFMASLHGKSCSRTRAINVWARSPCRTLTWCALAKRVVVMARIVRHQGKRFRSAPLSKHVAYLKREGVTRDGADARMFDVKSADSKAFAERCEDDRHHFRFTVSPEDATEMADLRTFTRELMADAERDLDTRLEWIAVDHWNTDNPHVRVLVRGRDDDGRDLVISRDYISRGFRARAEERVTLELGPRSEQEIRFALEKEHSTVPDKVSTHQSCAAARPGHYCLGPLRGWGPSQE